MFDDNTKIWIDGKESTLGNSKLSIMTHSLHYGSSVFEGIRCYETKNGPKIFRLSEHIDRLFYSAEQLFMEIPYSKDEIMSACKKVVKENNLKSAYLRPLVFYGGESMRVSPNGCSVHVVIIAWPWGKYLPEGLRVGISSWNRISERSLVPDAKIGGHYVNSILANEEAKRNGFDEALLLDHDGFIAEGSGENFFLIKDKTLTTPKLGKILNGITRDSIIQIGKELGYEVIEKDIHPDELKNYDSAFFTGTAAEVSPINEISGIKFDTSLSEDIKNKFFQIVEGETEEHSDWLVSLD